MIRYALLCEHDHDFEGWFGSSGDYDDQHARGLMQCPVCGSGAVRKAVMSPAVAGTKAQIGVDGPPAPVRDSQAREMMMQAAKAVREHVQDNFDYVGDRFADEARAMHSGKAEERGIYGEASGHQIKALIEEGVPVAPLPPKAPEKKDIN
jgi:hypothetical protein